MERRLAAILAADVVGYSKLMSQDEAGTLAALRELRHGLLTPAVQKYRGNLIKSMGDGWLVEFPSASDAVQCAIEVQEGLLQQDTIQLRAGLHLGDITFEDEDIYGDGVNIAARLQEIASPGALVISDIVRRSIDGKQAGHFSDLGPRALKNIPDHVNAFGWRMQEATGPTPGVALQLPDKPSIAVLPFQNMSDNPEQEYFVDGMTEEITTALSKIRWLFVIARNSTFSYKGSAVNIDQIAAELGVRYVLEGSVRRGGNRCRISAQLIDTMSGSHVWAERYDRDLDDIFELQDEISATIIAAIEPELSKAEQTRALRQTPDSLDAWSFFQRGMWHHFRSTQEDNALARVEIQKAIELDPNFSRALAVLAHVYYWDVLFGFAKEPDAAVKRGMNLARRAIVADDHEPFAHFALGRISTLLGDFDMAREELNIAVDLNPNFAHAHYALGHVFNLSGKPSKAVEAIDRAIRLNPNDPAIWTFLSGRAWSHQLLGQHDEAHVWALKGARQVRAGWLSFAILASTSAELGLVDETRQAVKETLNINPDFKVSSFMNTFPNRAGTFQKIISASLANAGLPE